MRRALSGALVALAVAAGSPAAALEAPKDYAGDWTMSGLSEGADACDVILTADPAIGGWSVQLAADCQDKFALPEDIAAWTVRPGGAVAFIDPQRKVLLTFEPTDIGGYVAHPAGGEPLALDRARADAVVSDQARMAKMWILTALGGAPTCIIQLTSAADGMSGAIRTISRCQAPWAGVQFGGWTRTGRKLTLIDRAGHPVITLAGDPGEGFTGETADGAFVGLESAAYVEVPAKRP